MLRLLLIPSTLLLLALSACGSAEPLPAGPAEVATAPAPIAGLPSPLDLLPGALEGSSRRRTSSVIPESQVQQPGNLYALQFPHNNVSIDAGSAMLAPDFGPGAGIEGLAYCTYHFEIPGYDRNPQVRLSWASPPTAADCFIGVANWQANRWDWFSSTGAELFELGTMEHYLGFSGDILVVAAVSGSGAPLHLDSVRIGALAPEALVSADDDYGIAPFDFELDASASSDQQNFDLTYEFDADGDGNFESGKLTDPHYVVPALQNAGTYHPVVRVTNSAGVSATAETTVHVSGPWTHTFGLPNADAFHGVARGSDGTIYAVGTVDTADDDLLLTSWSPGGELDYAKLFDSGEDDVATSIVVDAAGDLIIGGSQVDGPDRHMLLQKWDPEGFVKWSTHWGAPGYNSVAEVAVAEDKIFVGGSCDEPSGESDAFIACFNGSGSDLWQRSRSAGVTDYGTDLALVGNLSGYTRVALLAEAEIGGDFNIWKLEYELDGTFLGGDQLGTSALPKRGGQLLYSWNFLGGDTAWYVAGKVNSGSGFTVFLTRTEVNGSGEWTRRFNNMDGYVESLIIDNLGRALVTGSYTPDTWNEGFLVATNQSGVIQKRLVYRQAAGSCSAAAVLTYGGGLLIAGKSQDPVLDTTAGLPGSSNNDFDFTAFDGTGSDPDFVTLSTHPFFVLDVTDQGQLDDNAGYSDALLQVVEDIKGKLLVVSS